MPWLYVEWDLQFECPGCMGSGTYSLSSSDRQTTDTEEAAMAADAIHGWSSTPKGVNTPDTQTKQRGITGHIQYTCIQQQNSLTMILHCFGIKSI